jgi:protein-S-isoprenylcysteine O-methyltransferase Ste14
MKRKTTLLPPNFLLIYLVLAIILHFLFPMRIIPIPYPLLGILFIIAGLLINFWADNLFKKNKTTVKPNETPSSLIVSGPFSFSRHPMYLGFVFLLLGVAVLLNSLSSLLGPLMMFFTLEWKFIPFEEKEMEKTFGEKYLQYKKQIRRWF